MKRTRLHNRLIRSIFVLCLLAISYYSFTSSGAAPGGYCNAPGDNGNCTSCHSGSLITSGTNWNNMSITTNIPANGYSPGASYTITIAHTVSGINKWGIEAVILNATNFSQVGSVVAGIGTSGVTAISRNYITHNSSGTVGSSSKSWSFTWIAPSPGVGNVNIYAVVNAANGDNGSGGDQIYAKSLTVSELTNLPTAAIAGVPASGNVCLGDTLNLLGSGINSPSVFAWTFSGINNPTLQAQQNPKVLFTSIGLKTITLKTTNTFGSSSTTTVLVNIISKPTATISPSGSVAICGNDSVTLNANFNSLFTYQWSPGNETYSSIKTLTPGVYQVKVTNTTTSCFANSANVTLTAQAKPVAQLTVSKDSICSQDSLTLTGNGTFTNYQFFDNQTLVSSGASNSYKAMFPKGTRNIGLVVTGSGCISDTVRKSVFVQPLLAAPNITCGAKTTSSVSYNWGAINGASGYEVSVDNGKTWIVPNATLTHTITGLNPNSNAQLWVRAIDGGLCSRGNVGSLVCTNSPCIPLTYKVQVLPTACLKSSIDSIIVPITLSNISAANLGVSFNNSAYTKSLVYNAKVFTGNNSISLKIVDSSNIGCPRVDTFIQIVGIHPIGKTPVLGVQGALCSSDSASHTFEVYNANNGANLFQLFRNSDVTPFETLNASIFDTVRVSIPRAFSPIQQGDLLKVVAINSQTGCELTSLPYTVNLFESPKVGFITEVNSLTVSLTDTTAKVAKRNWKFFGAVTDEINGSKTVAKTFASAGIKDIQLVVTDSNGCIEPTTSKVAVFNVGVSEKYAPLQLAIYPNPVTSELMIPLLKNENVFVAIFDVHGKLIKQVELKEAERKIDTQALTPGLYLLYLTQRNTNYFTKFMKE
ncbi:hypothetical protein AEM51_07545 [Bacteroidetes bacterium UKL13-3]|nr:hypothetical protein AEM51_07545 [Bacteroidetes bacterium UKL13-3]HCP94477.1 hypothetical protein [Bacteroidota bacterium]